ncbi:MAG TPA: hypothetical protein VKO62_05900 [Solirubrobacterales bacterium]|nr:hypothetical protein [Solirubrobacterales bacterium]
MAAGGFGIKAATITPEGADDVGSPNRRSEDGYEWRTAISSRTQSSPSTARSPEPSRSCLRWTTSTALLHYAGEAAHRPSRALYEAVFGAAAAPASALLT